MSANSLPNPAVWHNLEVDKTLQVLGSDRNAGLSSTEVQQRLERYGPNELQESAGRSPFVILVDQFKNIMLLMLIAVAVVSAILDLRSGSFPKDAIAISLIVILNGILGYLQESRAEKALAALKRLSSPLVRVLRDGKLSEVAAKELVPGDVMLLEAGVQLAADGRLIEESNLQVRESALTGEAHAVEKQAELHLPEDTSLGDRLNLVFQGTEIVQGRAKAIVTGTGMQTELGRIAALLQSVESEPTPLQKRMEQLGNVLVSGSLTLVALVVGIGVLRAGWGAFEQLLEVSLSMAVAVVPEGLPAVITVTLALGTQRMVKRKALIRKLPAVETLGSVTTICSDKTGTLTQNKMVVQTAYTNHRDFKVTGEGYEPNGEFQIDGTKTNSQDYPELQALLVACALCNDSNLQQDQGQWIIIGDPTEGALLSLAGKAGVERDQWMARLPRVAEFPFSSERKRMSVICSVAPEVSAQALQNGLLEAQSYVMFTKGSPELTLERCDRIHVGNSIVPVSQEQRAQILTQNDQMASNGLRVLGFAYKPLTNVPPRKLARNLRIWLSLARFSRNARRTAPRSSRCCRQVSQGWNPPDYDYWRSPTYRKSNRRRLRNCSSKRSRFNWARIGTDEQRGVRATSRFS